MVAVLRLLLYSRDLVTEPVRTLISNVMPCVACGIGSWGLSAARLYCTRYAPVCTVWGGFNLRQRRISLSASRYAAADVGGVP